MISKAKFLAPKSAGSVLLLVLLVTGMIATLALSFASSMGTQIQIARDQAATLHADLAAQSGLEYAQRQLFLNPLWSGTNDGAISYAEGATFLITRQPGPQSSTLETEVELIVEGRQASSMARFSTKLQVDPGDPLLDKAISILGDISGSNIAIDGDFLILDQPGWLWGFRLDLIPLVQMDPRFGRIRQSFKQLAWNLPTISSPLHLRKKGVLVSGVWSKIANNHSISINLDRVDSSGALFHFRSKKYAWATKQVQEKQPIHYPGWDFTTLSGDTPAIRMFDHVLELSNLEIPETAVFLLDANQTLTLADVHFSGGLIIWVENDYDPATSPRNYLRLQGENVFGGGSPGLSNVGILAPGAQLTISGSDRQSVTGFSVLHSMNQVHRLHHRGILIILNSALQIYDSIFRYDPKIASTPPASLTFFGELAKVRIRQLRELFEAPTVP